ncbi:GNAT family N-acetyltransferase [Alkalicoccus luteus]|uniref:GNAT family N-acetyltransferase n=1 Tax=Alkalicoccus luteus TaxID=1237094 RepID=A0A969PMQ6_9BACI|nr:GNAT family N-acetyltransferase [Alkalicoccus luteus]NJP36255.1 GNAT family N-acetyltransferase [Alkalicoccus luteus]
METLFRKAGVKDAQLLAQLGADTFRETFAAGNDPEHLQQYIANAFHEAKLRQELAHPESRFYILEAEGAPAGYLKLNTGSAQTEAGAETAMEIERIYVRSSWQQHGFGKALLQLAFDQAALHNRQEIWLGVWEKNERAVRFYERYGFVITGSHAFYMGEEKQTDLIMTKTR